MEDMGAPCRHPDLGAKDEHQSAQVGDQYATRHNPFVYFESITSSGDCQSHVVDFTYLADDLKSVGTTPNLSYITPNLCNDGHDSPCVDGSPGGLASADAWLQQQVPAILDSPAYKQDGMLVITFDEADGKTTGPSGIPGGTAGGRVGALVLSPSIKGGTTSDTMYNHYSLLASIEDAFSLPRLGYADAPGLNSFWRRRLQRPVLTGSVSRLLWPLVAIKLLRDHPHPRPQGRDAPGFRRRPPSGWVLDHPTRGAPGGPADGAEVRTPHIRYRGRGNTRAIRAPDRAWSSCPWPRRGRATVRPRPFPPPMTVQPPPSVARVPAATSAS